MCKPLPGRQENAAKVLKDCIFQEIHVSEERHIEQGSIYKLYARP